MHVQSVQKYCFSLSNMQIFGGFCCRRRHGYALYGNGKNKHLGNGDYFVIIASSSHPLFLTEHAANGLVEAPLKYM